MKNGLKKGSLPIWIVLVTLLIICVCCISEAAAAGEKTLKGVWEYEATSLATVVFRDNGEYFEFNTFPAPRNYRQTRYTDDGHSFTLYFEDKEDPSREQREQYTYVLENDGDRLVIISRTDSRYVNGQLEWTDTPENENIVMKRNNLYENAGISRPAELGGYWESLGGKAYIRFGNDGTYMISPDTLPGGYHDRETYRYSFNGESFTLYFVNADYPSLEHRWTYFYTIEDQGNTLVIRTSMKEEYENGVRQWASTPEDDRLILFRTDSVMSGNGGPPVIVTIAPVETESPPDVDAGGSSDPGTEEIDINWGEESEIEYTTPIPLTPEEENRYLEIASRFGAYMGEWQENRLDGMLAFCPPSWVAGVEEPKTKLFILLRARRPLYYSVNGISDTYGNIYCTIYFTAIIDLNNGKAPKTYDMTIIAVREQDQWYMDPRTLTLEPVGE